MKAWAFLGATVFLVANLAVAAAATSRAAFLPKAPLHFRITQIADRGGDDEDGSRSVPFFDNDEGARSRSEAIVGTAEGLIATDGTPGGTSIIKSISSGHFGGGATLGNRVIFTGLETGSTQLELWTTNGTARGTSLIAALPDNTPPNSFGSAAGIRALVAVGQHVLFIYNDGHEDGFGSELWTTGGRAGDARQIPGVDNPSDLQIDSALLANNRLIFVSADGLQVTDGTPSGTTLLKAFNDNGFKPDQNGTMASLGEIALFPAVIGGDVNNRGGTNEIWRTDGTVAGTYPVISLAGDASDFSPASFFSFGRKALFSYNGAVGVSDGTAAGTQILPGISFFLPPTAVALHGRAIFAAFEGIFSTDGTPSGTFPLKSAGPGPTVFATSSTVTIVRLDENEVIFAAGNASRPTTPGPTLLGPLNQIWKTDGTAAGTRLIAILPTLSNLAGVLGLSSVGDRVLISYYDGTDNNAILSTDGKTILTVLDHATTDVQGAPTLRRKASRDREGDGDDDDRDRDAERDHDEGGDL